MSDFPGGSVIQNSPAIAGAIGDVDSVPGSGKSLEEIFLLPIPYSCLKNPMDRGALWATVHEVAKNWTQLN